MIILNYIFDFFLNNRYELSGVETDSEYLFCCYVVVIIRFSLSYALIIPVKAISDHHFVTQRLLLNGNTFVI